MAYDHILQPCEAEGRDAATLPIHGRVYLGSGSPTDAVIAVKSELDAIVTR